MAEIVALVGLGGLERRYPHELSGGQQQQVGIGRALARDPRVLLLDEPLSALDAPVRRGLIVEIRRLQQELRMTALYVTHDQEEALGMSDRVAVMDRGRIVEVGTPERLYRAPASPSGTSARWSAGAGRSRATARRSRPTPTGPVGPSTPSPWS